MLTVLGIQIESSIVTEGATGERYPRIYSSPHPTPAENVQGTEMCFTLNRKPMEAGIVSFASMAAYSNPRTVSIGVGSGEQNNHPKDAHVLITRTYDV